MIEIRQLLRSVDVEIRANDDIITLRIELFGNVPPSGGTTYIARVWRYDLFRLTPRFGPGASIDSADHEMLVVDPLFDGMIVTATNTEDAEAIMLKIILDRLNPSSTKE